MKLEMDHSVLSFSHKMKVLHIDLMIKRSTTEAEMACWNTDCKLYTKITLEQAKAIYTCTAVHLLASYSKLCSTFQQQADPSTSHH